MPKKSLCPLIVIVAILFSSCALLPVEETLPNIPIIQEYEKETVKQAKVQRGDLILSSDVRCLYQITKQESLRFFLGDVCIDQVYIKEGDSVKAGDLLISLEMEAITQDIASMNHALSKLQLQKEQLIEKRDLELKRLDVTLADIASELSTLEALINSVPEATELTAAKEKYEALLQEQTQQQEDRERIGTDYTNQIRDVEDSIYLQNLRISEKHTAANQRRLFAGISGTVTYLREIKEGQHTIKDQHMVTISDLKSACIVVKGDYAAYLPIGKEVTVSMLGNRLQAVVIDPARNGIKTEDGTSASYLKLLQPDPTLTSGSSGSIQIVEDQRNDVLYLDKTAIITSNGETFVYMLDADGLRIIQPVKTGFVCNDYVEILEGLEEGDLVIID